MQIATILGARPQFVKAAAVSRALAHSGELREILIHTGQHFDENMSAVFFDELGIRDPDYHLGIHGLSHGAMTGRMLESVEQVLMEIRPDIVMVYGDTDSTLAGALAAAKLHIPVAHVEAGLRAFNMHIPEEINRVLTDHVAEMLFTPTIAADRNLAREGIPADHIYHVGDVMYDATQMFIPVAEEKSTILQQLRLGNEPYYLVTIHRPQNTDDAAALNRICRLLETLADHATIIWPVHPRAAKQMRSFGIDMQKVRCIEPVGFLDMIALEQQAALILTDSGGVQKEAYFHRVPCVTLRPETEWVELIEHRWNLVLPPTDDTEALVQTILGRAGHPGEDVQLYGSGKASEEIARILSEYAGE